ncbi:pyridoxal-phosphate dependent enzyme [Polaribacter sp.]|nr:pyridoxal-phosphate dependent enzyme [Polaribacter sp.]
MLQAKQNYSPSLENQKATSKNLTGVAIETPLSKNFNLSKEYEAMILLKREDLQVVRSYKIRGAYNKMYSLTNDEKKRGIVCESK